MDRITKEQADVLREYRPKVRELLKLSDELAGLVADLCDHDDDRDCRICRLFRVVGRADRLLNPNETREGLAALWDEALENGPAPGEKG